MVFFSFYLTIKGGHLPLTGIYIHVIDCKANRSVFFSPYSFISDYFRLIVIIKKCHVVCFFVMTSAYFIIFNSIISDPIEFTGSHSSTRHVDDVCMIDFLPSTFRYNIFFKLNLLYGNKN